MGANVAPIMANIYAALLENELRVECKNNPRLKWPILLNRFIDDGLKSFVAPKKTYYIGLPNLIC